MVAALCRTSAPGGITRRSGAPPRPVLAIDPFTGVDRAPGLWLASAAVTEVRAPLGARQRWGLWIDGR